MSHSRGLFSSSMRSPACGRHNGQMKTFTFPLARVLDWRRTQVQLEETKLGHLHVQLRAIEARWEETRRVQEESLRALSRAGSVTGAELSAFDDFRKASAIECQKLSESAAAIRRLIAEQMQIVIRKRRDAKLLEHLRGQRYEAWTKEYERETDREASELHLYRSRK